MLLPGWRDTYRPVCVQCPPIRRPGRSRVKWVEGWPKQLSSAGHAIGPSLEGS